MESDSDQLPDAGSFELIFITNSNQEIILPYIQEWNH